jgi:hypothetical protein
VEGGEQAPGCLDLLLLPKQHSFINAQCWSLSWLDNHIGRVADPVHLGKFGNEVDYFNGHYTRSRMIKCSLNILLLHYSCSVTYWQI